MEGNDSAGDALENISDNCTVLGLSCLQADLQDVFLNPHLFPLTQVQLLLFFWEYEYQTIDQQDWLYSLETKINFSSV